MKNTNSKKLFISIFILVFAFILSSCGNPVSYSVEKEHMDKIEIIYDMISGLVNNDSELYLSTFEPEYIANIKNVVDTLGRTYFEAENFNDLVNSFFVQTKQGMEANYGKDLKVKITYNSSTEMTVDDLGGFIDDYSVGYKLPRDKFKKILSVSVTLHITGEVRNEDINCNFIVLNMEDGEIYLHPESFFYSF